MLAGSVALLLWGARMIRTGMMRAFGADLRGIVAALAGNRVTSAAAGAVLGTVLQSSTASALIAGSFVAGSALALAPALAIMLGADLGASIAVQVFTSGVAILWPLLGFFGYVLHNAFDRRSTRLKNIGRILIGLALLLLALDLLGTTAMEVRDSETATMLAVAVSDEPVLAILTGALMTLVAYSSVAMILLVGTLAVAGVVPPESLLLLVLGVNLGAALPALVAMSGEPREARRVPLGNLVFRLVGVAAAVPFVPYATEWLAAFDPDPLRMVVNGHLAFNIVLCLLFLPLTDIVARLAHVVVSPAEDEGVARLRQLDESLLETPSVAIGMAIRETLRMGDIVEEMLAKSMRVFAEEDESLRAEVEDMDDQIDDLHESIKLFLTRLMQQELDETDSRRCIDIISFTTNLEHVGDIIDKNLMELAAKKARGRLRFSREGFRDLVEIHAEVMETTRLSLSVFMSQSLDDARMLMARKDRLRRMEQRAMLRHLNRMKSGQIESIETSGLHLDIVRDLRRINSHFISVAYPILDRAGELRTTRAAAPEGARDAGKAAEPAAGGAGPKASQPPAI